MLTFRSVAVIAAFRQWQQRMSFVLAMTHMGTRSTSLTPLEMPRDRSNQAISKERSDLVALLKLQFNPPFFASVVCQKDGQRTLLGASNVNGAIKPAPTSLKVFQ